MKQKLALTSQYFIQGRHDQGVDHGAGSNLIRVLWSTTHNHPVLKVHNRVMVPQGTNNELPVQIKYVERNSGIKRGLMHPLSHIHALLKRSK